ncbi:MAG: light-regulated signal transduction histidine kinase (bacteriophytochrome), partial [Saprospiraceae bacterium]
NVYTNKPLLNQLFQNLLSNAIKFRKLDVDPIVLVRHEEKEEEHIFSVADNGIGIPEEFQERIFVIFQRLHSRTKYEGTGIGLAICQKIAQKLGGSIWLESEEGEGSTFYFSLPKK